MTTFTHCTLPVLGKQVHRLGLALNMGIDPAGIRVALRERGLGYVFWTTRMRAATAPLREALAADRERYVVATGPTTAWWASNLPRYVDAALKALQTDYLDVLQMHWLGVASTWSPATVEAMVKLRESGKVRALGVSIHDRNRAGELATDSPLDFLMLRYNAAHPGAEQEIFPRLSPDRPRAVVAYTATRWRKLLKAPKGWQGRVATAGDCYRFCLTNPHVNVVLNGPKTLAQLDQNLQSLESGPMQGEELEWMRAFGRAVHG